MTIKEFFDSFSNESPRTLVMKNIAQMCGVTPKAVYMWAKKGRAPKLAIEKIESVYEVELND